MDDSTKLTLLGVWMALFVVFAGRKFTQPIKVCWHCLPACHVVLIFKRDLLLNAFAFILQDDIGDKSVFMFNAMSEEEKAVLLEKLEKQNSPQNLD